MADAEDEPTGGGAPGTGDEAFAVFGRSMSVEAFLSQARGVIEEVVESGLSVVLTDGRPVAAIVPLDRGVPGAPRGAPR